MHLGLEDPRKEDVPQPEQPAEPAPAKIFNSIPVHKQRSTIEPDDDTTSDDDAKVHRVALAGTASIVIDMQPCV